MGCMGFFTFGIWKLSDYIENDAQYAYQDFYKLLLGLFVIVYVPLMFILLGLGIYIYSQRETWKTLMNTLQIFMSIEFGILILFLLFIFGVVFMKKKKENPDPYQDDDTDHDEDDITIDDE